jgi:hypothetical protein
MARRFVILSTGNGNLLIPETKYNKKEELQIHHVIGYGTKRRLRKEGWDLRKKNKGEIRWTQKNILL